MVCHGDTPSTRHVLYDDGGIAGNKFFNVLGNEAPREICSTTGARSDEDGNSAVSIEVDTHLGKPNITQYECNE